MGFSENRGPLNLMLQHHVHSFSPWKWPFEGILHCQAITIITKRSKHTDGNPAEGHQLPNQPGGSHSVCPRDSTDPHFVPSRTVCNIHIDRGDLLSLYSAHEIYFWYLLVTVYSPPGISLTYPPLVVFRSVQLANSGKVVSTIINPCQGPMFFLI